MQYEFKKISHNFYRDSEILNREFSTTCRSQLKIIRHIFDTASAKDSKGTTDSAHQTAAVRRQNQNHDARSSAKYQLNLQVLINFAAYRRGFAPRCVVGKSQT